MEVAGSCENQYTYSRSDDMTSQKTSVFSMSVTRIETMSLLYYETRCMLVALYNF